MVVSDDGRSEHFLTQRMPDATGELGAGRRAGYFINGIAQWNTSKGVRECSEVRSRPGKAAILIPVLP